MIIFFLKQKNLLKLSSFSLSNTQNKINYQYFLFQLHLFYFLEYFVAYVLLILHLKKDANNLSSLINLFFNGFLAAYLSFLNLTICALLAPLFFVVYNLLLFSSNIVNEVLRLFISNLFAVI